MSNQEDAYVIYDDFETGYLLRFYLNYGLSFGPTSYQSGALKEKSQKEFEEKYQYIKDVFKKALITVRNNQEVVIKKNRNNQIREIINTESELFFYINKYRGKRYLSPELINRLIDDLKVVPK
ncbi:hypothetical protein, partial [Clostridium beijerinckii]|uniref:hypothetical protein n=1 Tax=Clostridium beijerinckii TaxID=1520 RepID=UPI0005637254